MYVHFKENFTKLPKWLLRKTPHCSFRPAYIFHASATVRLLSMISLRSFTIALWIASSSFLAFRTFLFFSPCTRYWASKKADLSSVFSILWCSSSLSRLKRFSLTLKRIQWGWSAAFQLGRDLQSRGTYFEVQNILSLQHSGLESHRLSEEQGEFICLLERVHSKF